MFVCLCPPNVDDLNFQTLSLGKSNGAEGNEPMRDVSVRQLNEFETQNWIPNDLVEMMCSSLIKSNYKTMYPSAG